MIDLIIPYYNNRAGLISTLQSILFPEMFNITLIDDNSTEYPQIFPPRVNQVYRYAQNKGPGYARQWGINKTHDKWVMFIDTGDIFISCTSFDAIARAIQDYEEADIISFSYLYKDKIVNDESNRLHGKIYKREFLEKCHITFANTYLNEDIGFNRACRLCTKNIAYKNLPIIKWVENKNSLTQKNKEVSLYRDQTQALAEVTNHTIEICKMNDIDPLPEINQIAIALYYWFIRTAAECPQFIQDAWTNVHQFYKLNKNFIYPEKLLLGNAYLKKCLLYREKINFPINILRFANDIKLNDKVPNNYLT